VNITKIYEQEVVKYLWRNAEVISWEQVTIHVNAVGYASIAGMFEGTKATSRELSTATRGIKGWKSSKHSTTVRYPEEVRYEAAPEVKTGSIAPRRW